MLRDTTRESAHRAHWVVFESDEHPLGQASVCRFHERLGHEERAVRRQPRLVVEQDSERIAAHLQERRRVAMTQSGRELDAYQGLHDDGSSWC